MGLASFLTQLIETGRVRVPAGGPISDDDLREADAVLRQIDESVRLDAPGTPPPLARDAARWGAVVMFRACQALVDPEAGPEPLDRACRQHCPGAANPSSHYSVDLTLRYLPDLVTLARRTTEGDPLVGRLRELAADWPLSSVGIDEVSPRNVPPVVAHPALLRLYADRVIERRDVARLDDERVRDAVRGSLGLFPELAPDLAAALGTPPAELTTAS